MDDRAKRPLRILLVDDDHATVRALVRLLSQAGHQVHGAQRFGTAMDLARDGRYEALLCDIRLPEGDGYAVLRAVRSLYPIRALAITGNSTVEDARKASEAGFAKLLHKPIDPTQLLAELEAIGLEIDQARCR